MDRLEDDGGHIGGVDLILEQPVKAGDGVIAGDAPVGVGPRRSVDLGGKGPEAQLVGPHLGSERHGEQGPPVEGVVQADDALAAGVVAGDLHRVLHRLGSRVQQQPLLVEVAGVALGQQPAHLHVGLVGRQRETLVQIGVELLADGGHDLGVGMAVVGCAHAAHEVDEFSAVHIPDAGS